jgi:hypothetical protein
MNGEVRILLVEDNLIKPVDIEKLGKLLQEIRSASV